MKVIVVYGVHENELGKRVHQDLSRNSYAELNELANSKDRPQIKITKEDVEFKDLSGYGEHAVARRLMDLSLERILDIYEEHIDNTRMPRPVKEYLLQYIFWWKNWIAKCKTAGKDIKKNGLDNTEYGELCSFVAHLLKIYLETIKTHFKKNNAAQTFLIPSKLGFMLKDRVYFGIGYYLKTYAQHPLLKEALKKSENAFIIDLHSTGVEKAYLKEFLQEHEKYLKYATGSRFREHYNGIPFIQSPVFLRTHEKINFEVIKGDFQGCVDGIYEVVEQYGSRCRALVEGTPCFEQSQENFGMMSLETPTPDIDTPMTERYESLRNSPKILFFSMLLMIDCSYKLKIHDLDVAIDRTRSVDESYYATEYYRNAKREISRLIRAVLEWGTIYDE